MKLAVACCGTLLVLLSSCAKEEESVLIRENLIATETEPLHRAPISGSVEAKVQEIQSHKWATNCETDKSELKLEISRELDNRAAEIAKLSAQSETDSKKMLPIGPAIFTEDSELVSGKPGWQNYRDGWKEIFARYEKIKGTPTNKQWVSLNRSLRGMLSDDYDRVVLGVYYDTHPDDEASMRTFLASVNLCLAEDKCFSPSTLGSEKILRPGSLYKIFIDVMGRETSLEKKREYLARLASRIEHDLGRFGFRHNKSVRWADDGALVVSLDGSAFGEDMTKLAPYFETPWSVLGSAIRVEWEKADPSKNIFRILYSGIVGERAFVRASENFMQLYQQTSTRAIGHEFGHILGFRDRYFTVWHEDSCEYEEFWREDDIMSDHMTGTVLAEHWLKLQEIYPVTTR